MLHYVNITNNFTAVLNGPFSFLFHASITVFTHNDKSTAQEWVSQKNLTTKIECKSWTIQ